MKAHFTLWVINFLVIGFGSADPGEWSLLQNIWHSSHCLSEAGGVLKLKPCDFEDATQLVSPALVAGYDTNAGTIGFWSGRTMQVPGANTANGATVNAGFVTGTPPDSAKWLIDSGIWNGHFQLRASHTALPSPNNKCLTAEGGSGTGSYMDIWACSGEGYAPHQSWRILQRPDVTGLGIPADTYMLRSVQYPASCLDLFSSNPADGADAGLYSCSAWAANHKWTLVTTSVTNYVLIKNGATGKCLQVNGGVASDGTRVKQWTCPDPNNSPPDNFLFTLDTPDSGFTSTSTRWSFRSKLVYNSANKCINEAGSLLGLGGYSEVQTCADTPSQQFNLVEPTMYLKPTGQLCLANGDCLSNSCLAVCLTGADGRPCQTVNDCNEGSICVVGVEGSTCAGR